VRSVRGGQRRGRGASMSRRARRLAPGITVRLRSAARALVPDRALARVSPWTRPKASSSLPASSLSHHLPCLLLSSTRMVTELHRIPIAQRPAHGPWLNVRLPMCPLVLLPGSALTRPRFSPPQLVIFPLLFNIGMILINLTQLLCQSAALISQGDALFALVNAWHEARTPAPAHSSKGHGSCASALQPG
jgi:hypothetical protein